MVLQDNLAKLSPTFWQLGVGLLLIATVLFARRGLFGLVEDAARWWASRRGGEKQP
jgi:ABC-type branched-subunit amino acid transport system permease subunit